MLIEGLKALSGQRVLLLQGPVGPFFRRLAADLRDVGAQVHKVNFHLGDWVFYPTRAQNYRGEMSAWPDWLRQYLQVHRIDVVLCYGDQRFIHQSARDVCAERGVKFWVFEEGYVRPNCVTLQPNGVNGSASPVSVLPAGPVEPVPLKTVPKPYWHMVGFGFVYFTIGALGRPLFARYQHHRRLTIWEAWPWIRSVWRKHWFAWLERDQLQRLTQQWDRRYYLVPLQVFNDAQVSVHSRQGSVTAFMERVMRSFAEHAPKATVLVFKHHPMDRGYLDYTATIQSLAEQCQVSSRVLYIHDQHMPTLLDHARGVVLINSTTGIQALTHGVPVKALGDAVYNRLGLTFPGELEEFWHESAHFKVDPRTVRRFIHDLVVNSQVNGSFYRRIPGVAQQTGMCWREVAAPQGLRRTAL